MRIRPNVVAEITCLRTNKANARMASTTTAARFIAPTSEGWWFTNRDLVRAERQACDPWQAKSVISRRTESGSALYHVRSFILDSCESKPPRFVSGCGQRSMLRLTPVTYVH